MYKISDLFNINKLSKEVISQNSFGLNVVTLYFDRGLIQFSGSFCLQIGDVQHTYAEVCPVQHDYGLLILLEKKH